MDTPEPEEILEPTPVMKMLAAQLVWFDPVDLDSLILDG
jgi:hypothetical protein